MQQLTFDLAGTPPATFASFVAGGNGEVVDLLQRLAAHEVGETGVVVWGAAGAGKTHLLKAAVALAVERGRDAVYCADPSVSGSLPTGRDALVAVDDVDGADDVAQGRLFTLYNTLATNGGQLVAATSIPPASMRLRDDLRTRLGWGLVVEIVPLADSDKPQALDAFAKTRGFSLAPDAIAYLLAHGRRDMASLVQALVALDAHSLALRRPISVALIREWLQQAAGSKDGGFPPPQVGESAGSKDGGSPLPR